MPTTADPVRIWSRDSLAEHIESTVLAASQRTGKALPSERSMADTMGVSRSLVREVLRGLEQRGRLEIVPGKGAYPRDPSSADAARAMREAFSSRVATARDLPEARWTLEAQTAMLAAERSTPAEIQTIRRALTDFEAADSLLTKAMADIAFHSLIARASHNPLLSTMFDSIATLVFESMLRSLVDSRTKDEGAPLHYSLLDGLERRDPTAAAQAIAQHTPFAESTYGEGLDERLDDFVSEVLHRAYGPNVDLEQVVASALLTYTAPKGPTR